METITCMPVCVCVCMYMNIGRKKEKTESSCTPAYLHIPFKVEPFKASL